MNRIPLLFNPLQTCDAGSYSKSPGKAAALLKRWSQASDSMIEHHVSGVASRATIALAHSPKYVADVLDGQINNGFGNRLSEVALALPAQVGSLVDACRMVASSARKLPVACSPTSGFHHAHHDRGAGYCTFNGLVIAAQDLVLHGLAKRVGILDCDYHFGDGTTSILDKIKPGHPHWTAGERHQDEDDAEHFLAHLSTVVKSFVGCDLVIYQAGADQHIDDPLGGLLTTEQMAQRDRTVFWVCREYGLPLVWCLAGGYQTDAAGTIAPVLDLHHQTMQQCFAIYVKEQGLRP